MLYFKANAFASLFIQDHSLINLYFLNFNESVCIFLLFFLVFLKTYFDLFPLEFFILIYEF